MDQSPQYTTADCGHRSTAAYRRVGSQHATVLSTTWCTKTQFGLSPNVQCRAALYNRLMHKPPGKYADLPESVLFSAFRFRWWGPTKHLQPCCAWRLQPGQQQ